MKSTNKSDSNVIKFLNGKFFYAVLCVCFLCIGVAAWTGIEGLKQIGDITDNTLSSSAETTDETPVTSSQNDLTALTPSEPQNPTASKPKEQSQSQNTSESSKFEAEATNGTVAEFFINPLLGTLIKDFSDTELQYSMTYRDMRLHTGVDIAADKGAPVMAAGSGTVTDVYTDALLGTVVEIDHGNKITAKYCGLNATPTVKKGDKVDSSTQIGAVDTVPCESVEQHHLHLEFFLNGKAVSPLKYITQ